MQFKWPLSRACFTSEVDETTSDLDGREWVSRERGFDVAFISWEMAWVERKKHPSKMWISAVVCERKERKYQISRKKPRLQLKPAVSVVDYTRLMSECVKRKDVKGMEKLFEQMRRAGIAPNVYIYSTRMNGYAKAGDAGRVSDLFNEMIDAGIEPNAYIFGARIQTCVANANLKEASRLFDEMQDQYALKPDPIIYNRLLNVCAKAGDCSRASDLFAEMKEKGIAGNLITYNTLFDAYAECSNSENGAEHLKACLMQMENMKRCGFAPDARTYHALMKVCVRSGQMKEAREIFCQMQNQGIDPTAFSYSELIDGYSKTKQLSEAIATFNEMKSKGIVCDVITYTTLIDAYAECSNSENGAEHLKACLMLMENMKRCGFAPNARTYNALMKVCVRSGQMKQAREIFCQMQNQGIDPNAFSYSELIDGYSKTKQLSEAIATFNEMKSKGIVGDLIAYTTLIDAYAECSNSENGAEHLKACLMLMENMERGGFAPEVWTYNVIFKMCARSGQMTEARELFRLMRTQGINPTVFTYTQLIDGYSKMEQVSPSDLAVMIDDLLSEMDNDGIGPDAETYNSAMNASVPMGNLQKAEDYFAGMKKRRIKPNVISYTTLLKCYARLGDPSDAETYLKSCFDVVTEMESEGMCLGCQAYRSLIDACPNARDLSVALQVWNRVRESSITLDVTLFTAVIKACLSVNNVDKAKAFLEEMRSQNIAPDNVTLRTFYSYFLQRGMFTEAKRLFEQLAMEDMNDDKDLKAVLNKLRLL